MRGDMGLATLILFVVIILMATIAAIVMLQATNAVKTQASQTQEESRAKFAKRIVVDRIFMVVDLNQQSPYYKKGRYIWLQGRVPEAGAPVDLRKTLLTVKIGGELKVGIKYKDADGDEIFGENACEQDSPYPVEEGGDVNYMAFDKGDYFTVVWLQCNGKNEDYIIYPGQLVMFVYVPKDGVEEGSKMKFTFTITDGGITEIETVTPSVFDQRFVEFPV